MFDVRPMPEQISGGTLEKANKAEPATIGHFRTIGFPRPNIKLMTRPVRIAGTAVTLALPGADSTILHHAAGLVRPGDILLIDRLGDQTHAAVGGGVARILKRAGVSGVIIDGPYADPAEVRDSGLPLWATCVSGITTRIYGNAGMMNCPISIGGAVVCPGDLVIADEGGIVVIPVAEAERDIARALELQQWEQIHITDAKDPVRLGELTGASNLVGAKLAPTPEGSKA